MKLFYDSLEKEWYHTDGMDISFGKNSKSIPVKFTAADEPIFTADVFHSFIPAIGIMSCRSPKNKEVISGNAALFQSLHRYLTRHNIFSFIFTAEDVLEGNWRGLVYSESEQKWLRMAVPLPSLVYNRIPFRKFEESDSYQQLKQLFEELDIPMFNPGFIDKYALYRCLKKDRFLVNYLPETFRLTSETQLLFLLQKYDSLYLKPGKGNRGRGILLVTLNKNQSITVKKTSGTKKFPTLNEFWLDEGKRLVKKNYIAQRAITPKKINGHRYDFRILAHYWKGNYHISGKAIRMSQTQEVTTHIPKGGILYPYKNLQSQELDLLLNQITQQCGIALSKENGFYGEFSIDLGQDESGQLFIYEINAKPMQFDEEEIERTRLKMLKNLFITIVLEKNNNRTQ